MATDGSVNDAEHVYDREGVLRQDDVYSVAVGPKIAFEALRYRSMRKMRGAMRRPSAAIDIVMRMRWSELCAAGYGDVDEESED